MADINEIEVGDISDDESSVESGGSSDGSVVENELFEGGGGQDDDVDEFDNDDEKDDEKDEKDEENETDAENDEVSLPSSDSDEEDEEEEDDDYLQKLDDHIRKNVIEDHHPELKSLNYEEVDSLATVIRDKHNTIIDPLHRTLPMMTRYEKARILGERARQINSGAKPMIEVDPTIIDGYLIALQELEQKRIPFIIQRPLPNGGSEYWRVADLE